MLVRVKRGNVKILLCAGVMAVLFSGMLGLSVPAGNAAARSVQARQTFTCREYGYSFVVTGGWFLLGPSCSKTSTQLVRNLDGSAAVGIEVSPTFGQSFDFKAAVTADMAAIGIDQQQLTFGYDQMGRIRYDMAFFGPPDYATGMRGFGFLLGTVQNGLHYTLEGIVRAADSDTAMAVIRDMRPLYASVRYFKGSSPLFKLRAVAAAPAPAGSNEVVSSAATGGTIVVALFCVAVVIALLIVSTRRPAVPGGGGRQQRAR